MKKNHTIYFVAGLSVIAGGGLFFYDNNEVVPDKAHLQTETSITSEETTQSRLDEEVVKVKLTEQEKLQAKYANYSTLKITPDGREQLEEIKIEEGLYRVVTREPDGTITVGHRGAIDGRKGGYNRNMAEHPYSSYDIPTLLSLAEGGDENSYRLLAKKYQSERNYEAAEKWFIKAAESGETVGYFDLFHQQDLINGDKDKRLAYLILAGRADNAPSFVQRVMDGELSNISEEKLKSIKELIQLLTSG
ncbi:MAG: hypothetical protein ABJI60_06080 [Kangiellaceae bacterium]